MIRGPRHGIPVTMLNNALNTTIVCVISAGIVTKVIPGVRLTGSATPFNLTFTRVFAPRINGIVVTLVIVSYYNSLLN